MEKKLASEEAVTRNYNDMGDDIQLLYISLCICVDKINHLKIWISKKNTDYRAELLLVMLELNAFHNTILLDICTFLRANLRTKHPCEKRVNLKYINVAILEGYKYMQGFGKDAKYGKLSILQKIGQINSDMELSNDILTLKDTLDNFLKQYNDTNDKTNRDLALHYDQEPLLVYDFLKQISEENEFVRVFKWLDVLKNISTITAKYIKKNESILHKIPTFSNSIDINKQIHNFPDKDNKIYNSTEEIIDKYSNRLDRIVYNCRLPERIKEIAGTNLQMDTNVIAQFCKPLIQEIYLGIHIHYIYIDLACALKAYFTSGSFAERQLNLRRITVILYDGFARIYGYNAEQKEQSFWKRIYSVLQNSENIEIITLLTKTQNILEDLSKDQSINNSSLRECFIHYRKGNVDNVIKLHKETTKSSLIKEIAKTLKLLEILPEIIKLNKQSLDLVYRTLKENIEEKYNESTNKMYGLLDMILNTAIK